MIWKIYYGIRASEPSNRFFFLLFYSTPVFFPFLKMTSSDPIIQLSIPISAKLDRNNFLTWKSQIEPIIHGYGLYDFLDSKDDIPAPELVLADKNQPNPAYLAWRKQDQLLLGWLRSSIKESVLSQLIACRTSFDLWQSLNRVYAAVSSARVTDLRRQLQSTTRGGQSCSEYFEKMMSIADQLSASGSPVSDSDLVSALLSGLGPEFNSFVVAITTRSDPISTSDLFGYALAHEALLSSQHVVSSSADPVVFYAGKKQQRVGPSMS
jgi:gag-polypeptide of LTR copia-type